MNFFEQVPSNDWSAVTHSGEDIAEVWLQPEGQPFSIVFRVPQDRFLVEDITQQLTFEDLLTAAGIANEDVRSWQVGDESHFAMGGTNPELQRLLPPPAPGATHLTIHVQMKPPAEAASGEVPLEKWQALDALWMAILGLEAGIEGLRHSAESLRLELDAAFKKPLAVEDKIHALQADVAQWTKAKSRVHYVLPKLREFIHRATWALGVPERKRLEEQIKSHIEPRIPFPDIDGFRAQLEHLQKDRQVLSAQGAAVGQESRAMLAEIQRALGTLQRNAVDRARKKRSTGREKGKHF